MAVPVRLRLRGLRLSETAPRRPSARFPWGLTVACGLGLILLIGLGTWQVQRLGWKRDLIARAEAAAKAAPLDWSGQPLHPADEFRHYRLVGCDLGRAPHVELQSIHEGQAGVRLISACHGVLIDRGFVADVISARPPEDGAATGGPPLMAQLRVTGPPGPFAPPSAHGRFYGRDNAAMAEVLGVEAAPDLTLYATTSSNPEWAALGPSAPPAAFSNNHLGYALTWFGLAIALVGFYIALLRRRRAAPDEARP